MSYYTLHSAISHTLRTRLALIYALLGCGCGIDVTQAQHLGRRGSIAQAQVSAGGSARCSGRWAYRTPRCDKTAPRPECGHEAHARIERVPHYHPCRRPEFGIETWQVQGRHPHVEGDFLFENGRMCNALEGQSMSHGLREAFARCNAWAAQTAANNLGAASRFECVNPRLNDCRETDIPNTWFSYMFDVVFSVPLYREAHDHPLCPPSGFVEERIESPDVYASCAHVGNGPGGVGCAEPLLSDVGLTAQELAAQVDLSRDEMTATCTTCDAPDVGGAEMRGADRVACIDESWQRFAGPEPSDVAVDGIRGALRAELRAARVMALGEVR